MTAQIHGVAAMSPQDQQNLRQILETVHQGGMTVQPVRIADVGDVGLALRQGGRILPAKDPVVALALLPKHENSSPVYRKARKRTRLLRARRGTARKSWFDYGTGGLECQTEGAALTARLFAPVQGSLAKVL